MKIAFVTDSAAGISLAREKELGIHVLRMPVILDSEEYIEAKTINNQELIKEMKNGKTPMTSQPSIQDAFDLFEELLKTHDHIMYFPISKHLSGSYETSLMFEKEFENKLTTVDTDFVSWPLQQMTIFAKNLAEKGYNVEEIKTRIENEKYMYASLIPEDIQYLKRGGRIKPAAAAAANLLKIIPVLEVSEGEIDLYDKVRTHKKAVNTGLKKVLEHQPYDDYVWAVLSNEADETLVKQIVEDIETNTKTKVYQGELYPVVLSHTGPGTIAITAVKKIEEAL